MLSPPSSLLHSQSRRDPIVNAIGNFNLNQDANKFGSSLSQRGDSKGVRLSDLDTQYSNALFNANTRNFQTVSVNDSIASSDIVRPKTPSVKKLRKKYPGRDGYESDGGYISDKKAKKEEIFGHVLNVKQERKKKKSFIQAINKFSNDVPPTEGYETDSGAVLSFSKSKKGQTKKLKAKNSSKEIGYETDGGYQSGNKKSKAGFFKLSTKSSKGDFPAANSGPVPALPNSAEKASELVVPLPIAGRFATTLDSSPTTEAVDIAFPEYAVQSFIPSFDFASTASSPSPVFTEPSAFDRPVPAHTSGSPSAFNANVTHIRTKKRDSRLSTISSSSSGSGSNQRHKSQKRKGLFSPLLSPPSSMQGHQQQYELRTASSLSSLRDPRLAISLPITRATSPTSADLLPSPQSLHSLSASSTPHISHSMSFSSLKRPQQVQLPEHPMQQNFLLQSVSPLSGPRLPHVLSAPTVPVLQIPSQSDFRKFRPRNPPIDGFGPRSPLTSDSAPSFPPTPNPVLTIPSRSFTPTTVSSSSSLSPNSCAQDGSKRSSQLTIIPSSDYIVPSPQNSPLKTQTPEIPPAELAASYHHDHIPQPNPAPISPPSCESESPAGTSNTGSVSRLPSIARLRQRLSKMNVRQSVQEDNRIRLGAQRGRESPRPVASPLQSTEATRSVSVDDLGRNTSVGPRQYPDLEKSDTGPGADDIDDRQSWMDIDEDASLDNGENLEVEEDQGLEDTEDFYGILDRFENYSDEDGDIPHFSSGGQALERSHSFKAGTFLKEKRHYPDSFDAEPYQYNMVPAAAHHVSGFDDDGKTVGDRTSRWSGSVYSRSSILDEDESEEMRDRFVKRVEAMLDAERSRAPAYIPPLPKIPHPYANAVHKPDGNINENAGSHSHITPGQSWNKF